MANSLVIFFLLQVKITFGGELKNIEKGGQILLLTKGEGWYQERASLHIN